MPCNELFNSSSPLIVILTPATNSEFILKSIKDVEIKYPAVTISGLTYQSKEMLTLYMYGKYLHLDKDKKKIFKEIEQVFGPLAEVYALGQVDKYAYQIFLLAGHIIKSQKSIHPTSTT